MASKYLGGRKFQLSVLDLNLPGRPAPPPRPRFSERAWPLVRKLRWVIIVGAVLLAAGIAALVILPSAGVNWSPVRVTAGKDYPSITHIAGVDQAHAFASQPETFLSYVAGQWKTVTEKERFEIRDIAATDTSHVWVVGDDGRVYFYDGASLTPQLDTNAADRRNVWHDDLASVCALDSSHVWVVGTYRNVPGLNGVVYSQNGVPDNSQPVLNQGIVYFFNGHGWSVQALLAEANTPLTSVDAGDAAHAWAASPGSGVYSFDGASWKLQFGGAHKIARVAAGDKDHAWAVTQDGSNPSVVYALKGSQWTEDIKAPRIPITGIAGQGVDKVLAFGTDPGSLVTVGEQTYPEPELWSGSETGWARMDLPRTAGAGNDLSPLKDGGIWAVLGYTPYYGRK